MLLLLTDLGPPVDCQGYLSPFTVRYHVPLGLGLAPGLSLGPGLQPGQGVGPGRADNGSPLPLQQQQQQQWQPSAGLPGVYEDITVAGPLARPLDSPDSTLASPAQAGGADPVLSVLQVAVGSGVVRLDVPYIATLGPMPAGSAAGGAGGATSTAPARDSVQPAGRLGDVGGAAGSQAMAAAAELTGHSPAEVIERFAAPCWVPWAGGGCGTHGASSVPVVSQPPLQQQHPSVPGPSAACAEGQQTETGEEHGPPNKRHHAATEALTSGHGSAIPERIPAGPAAEDATPHGSMTPGLSAGAGGVAGDDAPTDAGALGTTSCGSVDGRRGQRGRRGGGRAGGGREGRGDAGAGGEAAGGAVWWFAYGAAVGAAAEQLGAVRSVPAVLPGGSPGSP